MQADDVLESKEVLQVLQRIEAHVAAISERSVEVVSNWLTVDQVAEELTLSHDTVERWIVAGKLPAAELTAAAGHGTRRRYRVRRDWLEDFLRKSVRQRLAAVHRPTRNRSSGTRLDFIG